MIFNSFEFLLFFVFVFLGYWFVFNRNLTIQNLFIVIVSYIFYGYWDFRFLLLIALTSFLSWYSGILMIKHKNDRKICKWITIGNISVNLLILLYFKYVNFFIDSFVHLFTCLGFHIHPLTLHVILPVGISFYTFQALSYTVDIYRGRLEPTRDIISFFAFVSFFPQLVAGPIERANNLLVQFYKPRQVSYSNLESGMRQMLWGFFKKMVIADNCALVVNDVYANYSHYSASTILLGIIMFTFQIYGDFSGYSDIAIGCARLFGFQLKPNFLYPYFSDNIKVFWKKWHISLNTWFIDYIYIPLGGNKEGYLKYLRNIFIIFLLSGLWHGANWTFVCWGIYHACLFILYSLYKRTHVSLHINNYLSIFITFVCVMLGWVIFRSESIQQFGDIFSSLFSYSIFDIPKVHGANNISALISLFFISVMLIIEWKNRDKSFGLDLNLIRSSKKRYLIYLFLFFSLYFWSGNTSNFIYFQF